MQLDRQALEELAQSLLHDPQFAQAKRVFCEGMTHCWLDTPLSRALIADTGTMAIAITIIGSSQLQGEEGASLQTMIDALVSCGLASATRIRSVLDMLKGKGAIDIRPHPSDGRRLVIAPTQLLLDSFRIWFRCAIEPVNLLFRLPAPFASIAAMPGLAERYVTTVMRRKALDNFTIFDNWPDVQAFADRRHGYVLLLHLACADSRDVAVPREKLAERYGVSPSHITALLVFGEQQQLLERLGRQSLVRLSEPFANRLDLWVAREIAIVGMWLEAKLGLELERAA